MFATSEMNRLPSGATLGEGGFALWAVVEMWRGVDVLILQFAASKRGLPRVAMVELSSGAVTLERLALDGQILRGAAVLSAKPQHESGQWRLELLREIHLGATRVFDEQHPLVSFARYTTVEGREISIPVAIAQKASRGKRIYQTKPAPPPKGARAPRTADVLRVN